MRGDLGLLARPRCGRQISAYDFGAFMRVPDGDRPAEA